MYSCPLQVQTKHTTTDSLSFGGGNLIADFGRDVKNKVESDIKTVAPKGVKVGTYPGPFDLSPAALTRSRMHLSHTPSPVLKSPRL